MKFQVLDRVLAQTVTAGELYAVISIMGTEQSSAILAEAPHRLGVLRLRVDDIQCEIAGMTLFDAEHGVQVLDFFARMRSQGAGLFIVHCEKGMCRSAAVAEALARLVCRRRLPMFRRFTPNEHIRRVLLTAAGMHSEEATLTLGRICAELNQAG